VPKCTEIVLRFSNFLCIFYVFILIKKFEKLLFKNNIKIQTIRYFNSILPNAMLRNKAGLHCKTKIMPNNVISYNKTNLNFFMMQIMQEKILKNVPVIHVAILALR
jgi:hypothetical protein